MNGCPWSDFTPATFPLCEELLCSWIRQPMNAFSNVGYLAVAVYLIARKPREGENAFDFEIGLCALLIALCSFLGHASTTRFFGNFDFASIYSIFSFFLALSLERFGRISGGRQRLLAYGAMFASSLGIMLLFHSTRVLLFAAFAVVLIACEVRLASRSPLTDAKRQALARLTFTFFAGVLALGLDASRTVCTPSNHFFQLHSIWHLTSALSILFAAAYLRDHVYSLDRVSK